MAIELREDWREQPHPSRLPTRQPRRDEILRRHADAMRNNVPVYSDPVSGLSVFTAEFLARRGDCCDSSCRHCPFVT